MTALSGTTAKKREDVLQHKGGSENLKEEVINTNTDRPSLYTARVLFTIFDTQDSFIISTQGRA